MIELQNRVRSLARGLLLQADWRERALLLALWFGLLWGVVSAWAARPDEPPADLVTRALAPYWLPGAIAFFLLYTLTLLVPIPRRLTALIRRQQVSWDHLLLLLIAGTGLVFVWPVAWILLYVLIFLLLIRRFVRPGPSPPVTPAPRQPEHRDAAGETIQYPLTGRQRYYLGLGLAIGLYLVLGGLVNYYNLLNIGVDGLSYLQIARRYAAGEFAVRGYWGPLLSWLTAGPMTLLGTSALYSVRVWLFLSGLGWLLLAVVLARRFGLNRRYQVLVAVVLAILAAGQANAEVRTGALSTALVLAYFIVLLSPSLKRRPLRLGVTAGVVMALAYFARAFNLPFFLVHLTLTAVLFLTHGYSAKKVLQATAGGLLAFTLVIAPWIMVVSARYGELTFSTSSAANQALMAPGGRDTWNVCLTGVRLCDQPADVLFPWEDQPAEYLPQFGWSPLDSVEDLQYKIEYVNGNLRQAFKSTLFPLSWTAVIVALMTFIYWRNQRRRFLLLWLLLTALLYSGGYLWLLDRFRYHYVAITLFLVALAYLLQLFEPELMRAQRLLPARSTRIFLVLLFLAGGIHFGQLKGTVRTGIHGVAVVVRGEKLLACMGEDVALLAPALQAPMAGTDTLGNHYFFPSALAISYYSQTRYYGSLSPELHTPAEMDRLLREFGVNSLVSAEEETIAALVDRFEYERVIGAPVCGKEYTVLRVPQDP